MLQLHVYDFYQIRDNPPKPLKLLLLFMHSDFKDIHALFCLETHCGLSLMILSPHSETRQ